MLKKLVALEGLALGQDIGRQKVGRDARMTSGTVGAVNGRGNMTWKE